MLNNMKLINCLILLLICSYLHGQDGTPPTTNNGYIQNQGATSVKYDTCYLFVEYQSLVQAAVKQKLREQYRIVTFDTFPNIHSQWEGWSLPNCDAEILSDKLLRNETLIIRYVGFNYMGRQSRVQTRSIADNTKNLPRPLIKSAIGVAFLDNFLKPKDADPKLFLIGNATYASEQDNPPNHGEIVYDNFELTLGRLQKSNPALKVNAYKIGVCRAGVPNFENVLKAIDECVARQVNIINISSTFEHNVQQNSPARSNFLELATKYTAKRLLYVCAAGNDGKNLAELEQLQKIRYYPAHLALEYPNIISVSAANNQLKITEESNYGNIVTVAVKSAQGEFCTSYSAPVVTAYLADYIAAHPETVIVTVKAAWLEAKAKLFNSTEKKITLKGYVKPY